jgi:excisionase family DNA binding protein
MADDEILRPDEAANFLKVSLPTLFEQSQKGEIPARKIGSQWRYSRKALQEHVAGQQSQPTKVQATQTA